ncbi:putative Serine/threonine-protein kinase SRK2C [Nannochloris sp. 'desiccata']|nr:putative Serine/threonine-protein kinase SRK2C [Chlorella desiccata (nom. nud.)]
MNMQFNPLQDHPTWEKIQDLARGANGFVILARNKGTGKEHALKFVERGQKITNHVEREILNHKKLQHPYVIELEAVFRTDGYLVLILEYANGGSLRKYLASKGALAESEARNYFQQLMLAVDYCHKMGVSSRDIKPDNILLNDNNEVKLADFGYSKDESMQSLANTRLGTPAYTAPEIFRIQPGGRQSYDAKAVDVWSCGVTLYQMLCAELPFKKPGDVQRKHSVRSELMMNRLLNGEFDFPQEIPLSDDVKDLLRCMLNTDPKARMTVKEISKHPWFQPGLAKGAMIINNMHATESRQYPPNSEEVNLIKSIIREAQTTVTQAHDGGGGVNKLVSCDMESLLSERYD